MSSEDRDAIYNFITNSNNSQEILGSTEITLNPKGYTLNRIYTKMDEIRASIYRSPDFTEEHHCLLKIPVIEWQLGWCYGSIFSFYWLTNIIPDKEFKRLPSFMASF